MSGICAMYKSDCLTGDAHGPFRLPTWFFPPCREKKSFQGTKTKIVTRAICILSRQIQQIQIQSHIVQTILLFPIALSTNNKKIPAKPFHRVSSLQTSRLCSENRRAKRPPRNKNPTKPHSAKWAFQLSIVQGRCDTDGGTTCYLEAFTTDRQPPRSIKPNLLCIPPSRRAPRPHAPAPQLRW
jgi:hypothetical protein